MDVDERRGINQLSPLLDMQSGLDIVWGLPIDEFHILHEGITKQMLKVLFLSSSVALREVQGATNEMFK